MTHKIDSTATTAVCTKTAWLPIDAHTPRGVKVLLLTAHGAATSAATKKGGKK